MSSAPSIYSSLILTILIAVLGTGCADDATRIERAKEHKAQAEYRAATIELKNILRLDPDNTEARTLLGQIALLNGDAATAIKELRRARELGAGPDLYAVDLARALLREGRYQEVVSLSPDLLSNTENRAALLALIGRAKLEQDDQQAASQNFAAALELVPDQSDALIGKAKLAEGQGDIAAAESSLTQMLQASPNDHQGLAALARVQYSKGDHVQAEQNFKKALDAIKGTGRAHERLMYMSGLLDAQLAQGKFTDAQAVGSNMIRVTSEHPVALLQAARADFAAKNYDGAIEKAERIITTLPTAEPPRMVLAAAAIAKRNTTLAATHLQAAININPENEIARKLLAQLRMQLGDPDEALEVLQPLMAAGTTDAQVLAMAGTASIRTGKTEIGVELVQRGMEMGVDDPAVALQAAANFLTAGELDRAIEVLESLPEADRVTQRELLLILALTKKGDIEGARTMAQAIVDASPELGESHRLMAAFHLSIDESDQARASLEKALQLNPDDTHSIMSLARLDITEQHPERAQARFNDVLKRRPGDLFALTALAELAEQRGAIDEGVALLEQAREANPESLVPILTLGRYYLRTGQLPLAEERANQAVRVSRSNGQSQMLLGMVMIEDGRSSEAIGHLERAIAAAPDLGAAHYHLGRAQLDSGLEEAGYKSLRRAIEVSPEDFRARAALAAAETKRGDFGAALAVVDGLISDYPDRKEPLVLKANIQVARKDLPAALELYEQAAKIEPSRELAARRFEIKRQLGMPQAWTELEEWVEANPDDAIGRANLARVYLSVGMADKAIENFKQVMATAPQADIAAALAMAYRETGDLDATASWLEKAIELDPDEMSARATLTAIEMQRGNTDQSVEMVRDLRRDFPDAPELYALEGEVLLAAKDFAGSIEAFDRAARVQPSERAAIKQYQARNAAGDDDAWRVLKVWAGGHPGDTDAAMMLAQDYSSRDWHDEAIDVYRIVLNTNPTNLVALNNIAWVYEKRAGDGDLDRSLNAAAKAYQQKPDHPAIADTYGWFLLKGGRGDKAVEILRAAVTSDDDPEIRYHYAAALEDQGRGAEATEILDIILAENKDFDSRDDAEILRRRLD